MNILLSLALVFMFQLKNHLCDFDYSRVIYAQIILDPQIVTRPTKTRTYVYTMPSLRNGTATRSHAGRPPRQVESSDSAPPEVDPTYLQLTSQNVTDLLNSLFVHYNKTFRPGYACRCMIFKPIHSLETLFD